MTRRVEPFPAQGFTNFYGPGTQTIYGADFTLTAAPGRVVEGVVRDEKDKKVMKDVEVWSFRFAGSNIVGIKSLKTRTDAEGRFRLAGFPKGHGNKLLIVPNDDQPYFMQDVAVPDPPGIGAIPVEIDLHRGIWIEGKLTDKETGAPVAGAWLHYLPFLDNQFAQATPEFRGGGNTTWIWLSRSIPEQGGWELPPGRAAGSSDRRGCGLYGQALSPRCRRRVDQGDERARALRHRQQPGHGESLFPRLDEGDQSGRGHGDGPSRPRARSGSEGPPPGGRPAGKARDRGENRRPPRPRPIR